MGVEEALQGEEEAEEGGEVAEEVLEEVLEEGKKFWLSHTDMKVFISLVCNCCGLDAFSVCLFFSPFLILSHGTMI